VLHIHDLGHLEDRRNIQITMPPTTTPRNTIRIGSIKAVKPGKSGFDFFVQEIRDALKHIVNLPVCSPAMIMRMIMLGKTGCLPRAPEMLSPRSMSVAAVRMAFSMMTLPTVWETIWSTSRIGTPLRTSEASVRVKTGQTDFMRNGAENGQANAPGIPELPSSRRFDEVKPGVNTPDPARDDEMR